jgi:murein DD-endopeptidase MepM/ murein hydrolase activator NlpD
MKSQTIFSPFLSSLTWGIATLTMAIATPIKALEVQINPTTPKLGETISVVMSTNTPGETPQVMIGGQNYPVFPLSGNNQRYRALLPTSPLDPSGTKTIQVTGDGETKNLSISLQNRTFPTQRITLSGSGGSKATQLELDRVAAFKSLVTPEKYWNGAFLRPNSGRVSTIYGIRRYYNGVFAKDYYHRGVDYAGPSGSPVVAPAAGRVSLIGFESQGFKVHGNTIGIDHGQGVLSIFLHLSRINVKEGDFVKPGQVIGTVGSTGASTGPHLHWGLYVHGISVDPVPWRETAIE